MHELQSSDVVGDINVRMRVFVCDACKKPDNNVCFDTERLHFRVGTIIHS